MSPVVGTSNGWAYILNKRRLLGISNVYEVETGILARLAGGRFLPHLPKHRGAETQVLSAIGERIPHSKLAHAFVKYTSPQMSSCQDF